MELFLSSQDRYQQLYDLDTEAICIQLTRCLILLRQLQGLVLLEAHQSVCHLDDAVF